MRKGQIFSLDFLLSIVIVVAATGLMIQAIELNTYYGKEALISDDMRQAAETTVGLIVASDDTTCLGLDGVHYLNCINLGESARWRSMVPAGYAYSIMLMPDNVRVESGALGSENFYEVKRTVVTSLANPAKKALTVRVWQP